MENIQKYEVLRMIERDGFCHISLDRVEGTLLIFRVQEGDILDKNLVLGWLMQLVQQLELFHRSGTGQCYRCLNPYSVLITADERIMLLDLDAESNAFVMRNMQKRAMRNHFVKPIMQIREDTKLAADLYSLGKTIQFILACTEVHPSFTLLEEYRLSKLIQKCLGENPKVKYQDFKQVLKEIPKGKKQNTDLKSHGKWIVFAAIVGLSGTLAFQMFAKGGGEKQMVLENEQAIETVNEETEETVMEDETEAADVKATDEETDSGDALEMKGLRDAFLENTKEGNEMVIQNGESLKGEILYYLSVAYDREGKTEEAINTYGMLCDSQCENAVLEQAFYRKIILERQNNQDEQAKATCEKGLERFPESEKLKELWKALNQETERNEANEEESEDGTTTETGTQSQTENSDAE